MSNLLEKASILLTPTAYDDGKILSVKPIDGSGDFQFTRNSSATRVNSQGLIEDMQTFSGNLVSNGDFSQEGAELVTNGSFTNGTTDWTFSSGASLTDLGAKITHTPTAGQITQANTLVVGKQYKFTYEITESVSGGLKLNSSDVNTMVTSVGVHTIYFKANQGTLAIARTNPSDNDVTITNISVKEVGQDWTFQSKWSIGNGFAQLISNDSTGSSLIPNTVVISGNKYKCSFDVVINSGSCKLQGSSGTTYQTIDETKTYNFNFIADSGDIYFNRLSSVSDITITNISVIEITDDTNLPRIDYSPYSGAGTCGHWLFEPQSTNLYLYSEPTANEGASGGVTYESFNWTIGFTNCVKYGDNSAIRYRYGGTVLASTEYTLTAFVIMDDLSEPIIGRQTSDKDFSLVISGSVVNPNSSVNMGNNIWRVSSTAISSASANFGNNGILKYTAQSSKGFRVVGYQLEESSFATSYIPTNGSTVTRLQDAAFGAGSSDLINSTEGVLYAEIATLTYPTTLNNWLTITDGTPANSVAIVFETTGNAIVRIEVGGVNQAFLTKTIDYSNLIKVAFKYKENNFSFWVNGVNVGSDTSGITFPLNTLNSLQFSYGAGGNNWNGKTKCVAVFKEALTDEELTCLTTI